MKKKTRRISVDDVRSNNPLDYEGHVDYIYDRVNDLINRFPDMTLDEARIREVISRYEGDNGLTEYAVEYLTAHMLYFVNFVRASMQDPNTPYP